MILGPYPIGRVPLGFGAPLGPIGPPPLPAISNGRWLTAAPVGDQQIIAHYGMVAPTLTPVVGEVGFTLYFSFRGHAATASELVFTKPSGAVLRIGAFQYEVVPPVYGAAALYFGDVIAYVFRRGDLDELGTWRVRVELDGIPISDAATFQVVGG